MVAEGAVFGQESERVPPLKGSGVAPYLRRGLGLLEPRLALIQTFVSSRSQTCVTTHHRQGGDRELFATG